MTEYDEISFIFFLRMMMHKIFCAFLFAFFAVQPGHAECTFPPHPPVMPQGATATDEEMKEGREELQKYVNILQSYQSCMDLQIKNAPPETKPETKMLWQEKANAAIDAAHQIADIYSIQLRAFKARQ